MTYSLRATRPGVEPNNHSFHSVLRFAPATNPGRKCYDPQDATEVFSRKELSKTLFD